MADYHASSFLYRPGLSQSNAEMHRHNEMLSAQQTQDENALGEALTGQSTGRPLPPGMTPPNEQSPGMLEYLMQLFHGEPYKQYVDPNPPQRIPPR